MNVLENLQRPDVFTQIKLSDGELPVIPNRQRIRSARVIAMATDIFTRSQIVLSANLERVIYHSFWDLSIKGNLGLHPASNLDLMADFDTLIKHHRRQRPFSASVHENGVVDIVSEDHAPRGNQQRVGVNASIFIRKPEGIDIPFLKLTEVIYEITPAIENPNIATPPRNRGFSVETPTRPYWVTVNPHNP